MKNTDMGKVRILKKTSFMNLVQKKIHEKVYENLEKEKKKHSKVRKVEHSCIKMQTYLQPNKVNISREEAQLIFKLRCRVTEATNNLKGKYDNL